MGNIVNFAIKTCCHRLYTGCKGCRIIGVSGFCHKRRTCPFSVLCPAASRNLPRLAFQHTFFSYQYLISHCYCKLNILVYTCVYLSKGLHLFYSSWYSADFLKYQDKSLPFSSLCIWYLLTVQWSDLDSVYIYLSFHPKSLYLLFQRSRAHLYGNAIIVYYIFYADH